MIFVPPSKFVQGKSAGSGEIFGVVIIDIAQLRLAESAHGIRQFGQECIDQRLLQILFSAQSGREFYGGNQFGTQPSQSLLRFQ